MLTVTVDKNQSATVIFDITGNGEGIICYYIREVKLTMKKQNWRNNQATVEKVTKLIKQQIQLVDYKESENEQVWILHPCKLIGFNSLAFFQPAIEMQHNELMQMVKDIVDVDDCEMVLDVIY